MNDYSFRIGRVGRLMYVAQLSDGDGVRFCVYTFTARGARRKAKKIIGQWAMRDIVATTFRSREIW